MVAAEKSGLPEGFLRNVTQTWNRPQKAAGQPSLRQVCDAGAQAGLVILLSYRQRRGDVVCRACNPSAKQFVYPVLWLILNFLMLYV